MQPHHERGPMPLPDNTAIPPGTLARSSPAAASAARLLIRPTPEDARLEQDLAQAIERGQMTLHFQPRFCLEQRRIVGAEALARWPHRRRGMVAPAVFIPLAERSGQILPLGRWVLEAACVQAASWPGEPVVSVNVSGAQLAQGGLLAQVKGALTLSGLPAFRLELELTESMLIDAGIETLLTLSAIRDLGIGIALDDFGTGYASLATLKRLPLTVMKLDRSLVQGMLRYPEDTAIAHAVIAVGRALGLSIVAEGVDNEAQCRALLALGCCEGQSFFLGRPMPGDALRRLLSAPPGDGLGTATVAAVPA